MKVDLSDGFYRVGLNADDIPKLGVAFPTVPGEEQLIVLPLVLPMGCKKQPFHLSAVTETITNLGNACLLLPTDPPAHNLDDAAKDAMPSNPFLDNKPKSGSRASMINLGRPESADACVDLQASTASELLRDEVDKDDPQPIVSHSSLSVGDLQASAAFRLVRDVNNKYAPGGASSFAPSVGTRTLDDEATSYSRAANLYARVVDVSHGIQPIVSSSSLGPPKSTDALTPHSLHSVR